MRRYPRARALRLRSEGACPSTRLYTRRPLGCTPQLARSTHPAVQAALAALATIAADEARHAELAYRTVAWAIREGGAPVREAVAAVFAELGAGVDEAIAGDAPLAEEAEEMEAHGRLDMPTLRATLRRAFDEVVRPAAQALLSTTSTAQALLSTT